MPIIDSIAAVAILRSLGTGKSHAVRNLPMRTDAASLGRLEVGQAIYTGPGTPSHRIAPYPLREKPYLSDCQGHCMEAT